MADQPDDADLFSAALAFSRQALLEARIGLRVEAALETFLNDVRALAIREDVHITTAQVGRAWEKALDREVVPHFDDRVLEYVVTARDGLQFSDIPDDVYTVVNDTLEARRRANFSTDDVPRILDSILFGKPLPASLTAAARKRRVSIGADVLDVHPSQHAALSRFLDTIGAPAPTERELARAGVEAPQDGTRWVSSARLATRMLATGLDGTLTQWRLQRGGVPYKAWVSRHDKKVRPTHLAADGQVVPTRDEFVVGATTMRWPGDRQSPIEETANCRCVMVGKRKAS
jgi:hypothetical protein